MQVNVLQREAAWWRYALSRFFPPGSSLKWTHSPLPQLIFRAPINVDLVVMSPSTGLNRLARPVLLDHLSNNRCAVIVNFSTPTHQHMLSSFGIGGVPCGNANCTGGDDKKWHTVPVGWSHHTRAPWSFVDENGASNPLIFMKMK